MNNKKIGVIIGLLVILSSATLVFTQQKKTPASAGATAGKPAAQSIATPIPTPAPTVSGFTMAQVAAHNNSTSCWSAINGNVYNLTDWIGQHPGGEGTILMVCGRDGSALFNDQHGGARRPANELVGFKIGALIK